VVGVVIASTVFGNIIHSFVWLRLKGISTPCCIFGPKNSQQRCSGVIVKVIKTMEVGIVEVPPIEASADCLKMLWTNYDV
jgi:hypothetical protein